MEIKKLHDEAVVHQDKPHKEEEKNEEIDSCVSRNTRAASKRRNELEIQKVLQIKQSVKRVKKNEPTSKEKSLLQEVSNGSKGIPNFFQKKEHLFEKKNKE